MGKQLVIKGADFSRNGFPAQPLIDITSTVLETLLQVAGTDSGPGATTNNTRVTTPVMAISSFGAVVGDKIMVDCPLSIVLSTRQGSAINSVPLNKYWYATYNPGLWLDPYQGKRVSIDAGYIMFSLGKGRSGAPQAVETLSVSTVQSYISGGQIKIYLEKAQ